MPTGLNPGYIVPSQFQPFYSNTSNGQGNYYWGSHPFQGGNTFNSQLYNTVPNAPAIPYGVINTGPVMPNVKLY